MTAAEGSFIGLAKQTAEGAPNVTDAEFEYMLFQRGAFGPNNIFLPLPPEVGGGAMQRSVVKVGVNSGGGADFIPRPGTLGHLLYGVTGVAGFTADTPTTGWNTHDFKLNSADEFSAPWYTFRYAPGNMWGESYQDCRINLLALNFSGANFLTGTLGMVGGLPAKVSPAAWSATSYIDSGPQFLSPVSSIEIPTATSASVLSGSFVASSVIPLDEQYVVGNYSPEGLDIVHRTFVLNLALKIDSDALYTKMMYDPADGDAWLAAILREADIKLEFLSDNATYKLVIAANGQNQAAGDGNIYWSAQPLALRAQRQVVLAVTGMFTATDWATYTDGPIQIQLINAHAQY
ncbi:MAG: hypothetical protein KAJ73_08360 [Zetaproteobacteria bacterium]|nr:hypothetical protein [Zetaproteobacteria bacterium]